MDTNEYKQKLLDLFLKEMNKQRSFDKPGMIEFVKVTAEALKKNNVEDLNDALAQITNFSFSVGFNEGLRYAIESMNKVDLDREYLENRNGIYGSDKE